MNYDHVPSNKKTVGIYRSKRPTPLICCFFYLYSYLAKIFSSKRS